MEQQDKKNEDRSTDLHDTTSGSRFLRAVLFSRVTLLLVALLVAFTLVELGLRGVFAARVGPDVLLYGTRFCCGPAQLLSFDPARAGARLNRESHTVHIPEVEAAAYRKYNPGQVRSDYTVAGEPFDVRINNHGFRGADFAAAKDSGVVRVLTLGASSTFGYRSRDDETYPVVLEGLLDRRLADSELESPQSFEVINLGIPHLWSGQILALLEAEALPLRPDVVTLYTGMNDAKPAARFRNRPNEYRLEHSEADPSFVDRAYGFSRRILDRFSGTLITAAFLRNLLPQRGAYDAEQLRRFSEGKAEEYIANVAAMRTTANGAGAVFIVISQQAHYSDFPRPVAGVTYGESALELEGKLDSGTLLTLREIEFLTHARLMNELEAWSKQHGVPFVDGIAVLDSRRDLLASYVHLTPEANRMLASKLADAVWERTAARDDRAGP